MSGIYFVGVVYVYVYVIIREVVYFLFFGIVVVFRGEYYFERVGSVDDKVCGFVL